MGNGTTPAHRASPRPENTHLRPMSKSHIVPHFEIQIAPDRQRRYFDQEAHTELINSISGPAGLLHAVVVRKVNDEFHLVAGERRIRAMLDIWDTGGSFTYGGAPVPSGGVPCNIITELNALDAEEAELEENIRRADLTWQEQIDAWGRLHELRQRQAAENHSRHTAKDTAIELFGRGEGAYQDKVQKALHLRSQLADPEVRAAKTVKEAIKVLERKDRARENAILATQVDAVESPHTLLVGSCLSVSIPSNDYAVIITDPPYGMGADTFGDSGGLAVAKHNYRDDEATFQQIVLPGLKRAMTYSAQQAHMYVFCDFERFQELRAFVRGVEGWEVFRTPLIWVRDNGRVPLPEHGPRRLYECILYARRGGKKVNVVAGDVLQFPSDENLGLNAQKPVALYVELLKRSARPGDFILDPFCGTGPIFPAAAAQKCRAVGIEQEQATAGIALARIKGLG